MTFTIIILVLGGLALLVWLGSTGFQFKKVGEKPEKYNERDSHRYAEDEVTPKPNTEDAADELK